MIGAKRAVPQGVRLDILNALDRFQFGDYSMPRYARSEWNWFVVFVGFSAAFLLRAPCFRWLEVGIAR